MTDTSTQNTAATPTDEYGAEIHPKHSFSPIEKTVESFGKTFKLQVPETEIQLDDSPTGPNAPVRIYRTRGPWAEPTKGLEGLRSEWIEARGDVEPYEGRRRNLLETATVQSSAARPARNGRVPPAPPCAPRTASALPRCTTPARASSPRRWSTWRCASTAT